MKPETLLRVEGMDCANCAMTITRTLEKKGYHGIKVDFASGEVRFEEVESGRIDQAVDAVNDLGYEVVARSDQRKNVPADEATNSDEGNRFPYLFVLCAVLSLPLMGHMVLSWHPLHDPWVQFVLCTPVMMIGWRQFGKSAWKSIRAGVPNMDVLVTVGATSAYLYSLPVVIGSSYFPSSTPYFETAASIITFILLGNLIEQRSVRKTTDSIRALQRLQPDKARRIIHSGETEQIEEVPSDQLAEGDIVSISEGGRVPADGIVLQGMATFDESMMTGESLPVTRAEGQPVMSGTMCVGGTLRIRCTATGMDSTLHRIIGLVKDAQHDKPGIQRLGDRVSAVFVPVVVGISIVAFFVNRYGLGIDLSESIMRSIAVLVISCPCAMGLATPTAVMVGIGRAAREGILIKGGSTLERLAKADVFVFDKTGTLTTGDFELTSVAAHGIDETELIRIVYGLELTSHHPLAKSIIRSISDRYGIPEKTDWEKVQEDKGVGIHGWNQKGDLFSAGSHLLVAHTGMPDEHAIYVTKNNQLIGTIDLSDRIKHDVVKLVSELHRLGKRVLMMSGDSEERCKRIADEAGITEYRYRLSPHDKLSEIKKLSATNKTVMVGDGINDAPALAASSVGVSISGATDVAVDAAQVILLKSKDLSPLIQSWKLSKMTYTTIRQNLFWAFIYNIVAIPFAAAGQMSPMFGALSMAFSDVIVVGNSLRLNQRKIK
ncbi:MAG: heavy metal translocating P-type ATPase [Bacteroidota bacterium]